MTPAITSRLPFVLTALILGCGGNAHSRWTHDGLEVHTFTRNSTNAHLVVKGDAMVLVDSGYEGEAAGLEQDLKAAGFAPEKIKAIIITHGHADHAGGARALHEKHHMPIVGGADDNGMFATGKNERPFCPTGLLGNLRKDQDEGATYSPTQVDVLVSQPTDLRTLAELDGTIVPIPGHTKGSLAVVVGEVALVGDLFRGSLTGSSAETHLYMCDLEANKKDIARLVKELAPNAKTFFVGHFGPVSRESVIEKFEVK